MAEREGDTHFGELDDLGVGVASDGPAPLNVGGLGPPAITLVMVEDANHRRRLIQAAAGVRRSSACRPMSARTGGMSGAGGASLRR